MTQKYILVVRDKIYSTHHNTDETLERLDCLYKSPIFLWDGTLTSADAIIDKYLSQFNRMIDWTATFVAVG